ncbi:ArdC family protein [Rothia uropygialis]|uniref:ArdC family protein n=1 Tax=Kocuria sp. 36 TaxID=1415402 RepID=UPI00101B839D|nr:ArdC family protein [Kocuria sp. 36]
MTTKQNRKEAAKEQRKELREKLAATAERIETNPEAAAEFEKFARRFPSYSPKNQQMIWMQNENATICAGFRKWQAEGRQVRKGEKGLKIFAPTKRKIKDAEGNVKKNDQGEDEEEAGFVMVTVFDISQTEVAEAEAA